MKHLKNDIENIAKAFLESIDFGYMETVPFRAWFKENEELRNGKKMAVWTVAFEYQYFESKLAFIKISDETGDVLYLMDGHGYLENDGSR